MEQSIVMMFKKIIQTIVERTGFEWCACAQEHDDKASSKNISRE